MSDAAGTIRGRFVRMWGQIGATRMTSVVGRMIGPPTANP